MPTITTDPQQITVLQGGAPWSFTLANDPARQLGLVYQGTSPWVVSGSVLASQSGAWTVAATQSGAWTTAATQSGAWSCGRTWTLNSATDSMTVTGTLAVTQAVSPWVVGDGGGSLTVDGTITSNQGGAPWTFRMQDGNGAALQDVQPITTILTTENAATVVGGVYGSESQLAPSWRPIGFDINAPVTNIVNQVFPVYVSNATPENLASARAGSTWVIANPSCRPYLVQGPCDPTKPVLFITNPLASGVTIYLAYVRITAIKKESAIGNIYPPFLHVQIEKGAVYTVGGTLNPPVMSGVGPFAVSVISVRNNLVPIVSVAGQVVRKGLMTFDYSAGYSAPLVLQYHTQHWETHDDSQNLIALGAGETLQVLVYEDRPGDEDLHEVYVEIGYTQR